MDVAVAHIDQGVTNISSPGLISKAPTAQTRPDVHEFTVIAYLTLKKDGVRKKCYIARLLGLQYIPNEDPLKIQIDHIDRNKLNNSLDNLRWVSQTENLANKNRKGCVYEDKRKDGKIYWKSSYSYYEDGKKIIKQKTARDKEDVEKWLEELKKQKP